MVELTKLAMKAAKFYKHVVQSIEKFINKVRILYYVSALIAYPSSLGSYSMANACYCSAKLVFPTCVHSDDAFQWNFLNAMLIV